MVGRLKLFNSIAREAIVITDDQLVNFDARFWKVANDDEKARIIRLEEINAKRQERRENRPNQYGVASA